MVGKRKQNIETKIIELVSQNVSSPHLINFNELLHEMEQIYPEHIDKIKNVERDVDELIELFTTSTRHNLKQFIDEFAENGEVRE
jgi:hypothetical protein